VLFIEDKDINKKYETVKLVWQSEEKMVRMSETFNGFEDAKKHCKENRIEPVSIIVIWEVGKVKGEINVGKE